MKHFLPLVDAAFLEVLFLLAVWGILLYLWVRFWPLKFFIPRNMSAPRDNYHLTDKEVQEKLKAYSLKTRVFRP